MGAIVFRIAIIIGLTELVIMLALSAIPHRMHGETMSGLQAALVSLLNPFLLILIASPIIYAWVVKPYVVERDAAQAEITHLAHVDPLTQLANRRLVDQHLRVALAQCTRHGHRGALIVLDLNGFKPINDQHGHDAGDALLAAVGARLRHCLRTEDVVGRLGGDEFAVVVGHLDADPDQAIAKARCIAEKLSRVISLPVEYGGQSLQVGASLGIALLEAGDTGVEAVYKRADDAMYGAKRAGQPYGLAHRSVVPLTT